MLRVWTNPGSPLLIEREAILDVFQDDLYGQDPLSTASGYAKGRVQQLKRFVDLVIEALVQVLRVRNSPNKIAMGNSVAAARRSSAPTFCLR